MLSLALVLIAAAHAVTAAVLDLRQATQCAVCPKQIGPDASGTVYPLQGESTQLGAPTFCLYSTNLSRVCWYSPGGGLLSNPDNSPLCPASTTTKDCPPP